MIKATASACFLLLSLLLASLCTPVLRADTLLPGWDGLSTVYGSLDTAPDAGLFLDILPPVPVVNYYPDGRAARVTDTVLMKPLASDPLVAWSLEQAAVKALFEAPAFRHVRVTPLPVDPVPLMDATGLRPMPAYELLVEVTFGGPPGSDVAVVDMSKLLKQLQAQWFVAGAVELPNPPMMIPAAAALVEAPVSQRQVGVWLRHDAAPRPCCRVDVPVRMLLAPTPVNSLPLPGAFSQPYLAVSLNRMLVGPTAAAAVVGPTDNQTAYVPTLAPPGCPLLAIALFTPSLSPAHLAVTVDPENLVPELDETDNTCRFDYTPPPPTVFAAHAWFDWNRASLERSWQTLANLDLVVDGVLTNRGDADVTVEFPTALQLDFAWGDLYRWSDGRAFTEMLTAVVVPAGQSHTWSLRVPMAEIWPTLTAGAVPMAARLHPLNMNLLVGLAGTDYRALVPVAALLHQAWLDANAPDALGSWDAQFAALMRRFTELAAGSLPGETVPQSNTDAMVGWLGELAGHPEWAGTPMPQRVYHLHLFAGWNLVSLPIAPETPSPAAVFGSLPLGPVWQWQVNPDTQGGGYVQATEIKPFQAYWLYVTDAADIAVTGTGPGLTTLRFASGNNLAGLDHRPQGLPADMPLDRRVWRWAADRQCYELEAEGAALEEGQGFWIQAHQPCELQLGGE